MARIKNKSIMDKADKIAQAWAEAAKEESFGGETLETYTVLLKCSEEARTALAGLDAAYAVGLMARDAADAALNTVRRRVVDSVRADKRYGPDSGLYKAMGFVPDSHRSSGLTQKTTEPPTDGTTESGELPQAA